MDDPQDVLDYWLDEIGPKGWYAGGAELDADIRERFLPLWEAARGGGLDHWVEGAAPTLAFIVLTDQFPRNMFRGEATAFATDPLARAAAEAAVGSGWDMAAPEPDRQFFYLPYEHAEDLALQDRGVALFAERLTGNPDNLLHAKAHREIIRRFGRFPFRNDALGRETTEEEQRFLDAGGYPAFVRAMADGAEGGQAS